MGTFLKCSRPTASAPPPKEIPGYGPVTITTTSTNTSTTTTAHTITTTTNSKYQ